MNPIDGTILPLVNQFAQRSWVFDKIVSVVSGNFLLTGGTVTALYWWAWFRGSDNRQRDREFVIGSVVLSTVAIAIGRALALLLPFRERPLYSSAAHFRPPLVIPGFSLLQWSSFPSDHAVLYASLAMGLFMISRRIGILAFLYAGLVVCFPLVYLGAHYPTDLLAGGILGAGVTSLIAVPRLREAIAQPCLQWLENSPRSFYPALYLSIVLVGTEYDSVRTVAVCIWKILKHHVG